MRKIILTGAALTLMCGTAFAQTSTGPAAQGDNMNKPGMTSGTMDKVGRPAPAWLRTPCQTTA
jgi:hypothetical protein